MCALDFFDSYGCNPHFPDVRQVSKIHFGTTLVILFYRADNVTRSDELHSPFFRGMTRGTKMANFTIGEACPQCKSIPDVRMRRNLWMRMIPLSRHYFCSSCNSNFVSVENTFSFSSRTAPPSGQQPLSTPPRRARKGPFRF
jgi:hypothetical protein